MAVYSVVFKQSRKCDSWPKSPQDLPIYLWSRFGEQGLCQHEIELFPKIAVLIMNKSSATVKLVSNEISPQGLPTVKIRCSYIRVSQNMDIVLLAVYMSSSSCTRHLNQPY